VGNMSRGHQQSGWAHGGMAGDRNARGTGKGEGECARKREGSKKIGNRKTSGEAEGAGARLARANGRVPLVHSRWKGLAGSWQRMDRGANGC
jgi:hypothetical protein